MIKITVSVYTNTATLWIDGMPFLVLTEEQLRHYNISIEVKS